ncbi:hypothetical protein N9051_01780 [Akkermansiaceae bacterium]|nr:hypothetical protein [Akkermansiaceae bacterium]
MRYQVIRAMIFFMKVKHLALLFPPLFLGLGACSSKETETSAPEVAAVKSGGEFNLRQNNPYEWNSDDVQGGSSGTFAGGKRSQYDQRKMSSYAKSREMPDFYSREFHSKNWNGSKDYSAGSYQVSKTPNESGKRSWFGGKKSSHSGSSAYGVGKAYDAGSYRTASAREAGQASASTGTDAGGYVESRRAIKRKPLLVMSKNEYRQMSVDQTRSLLGKGDSE